MSGLSSWNLNDWRGSLTSTLSALIFLILLRHFLWKKLHSWVAALRGGVFAEECLSKLKAPVSGVVVVLALEAGVQMAPAWLREHPLTSWALKVALTALAVWILDALARVILKSRVLLSEESLNKSTRTLLLSAVRITVFGLGLLMIMQSVGIAITPILASLGVGSIAVAMALQDTLSNFFSGVYLLVDQPIRVGDTVRIDDSVEGVVRRIGWRSTQIELSSGNLGVMPNSKISSSRVTNFDLPTQDSAFSVGFHCAPGSDLNLVEKIATTVAGEVQERVEGCLRGFPPVVRFLSVGGAGVEFSVTLRVRRFSEQALVRHEVLKTLHTRLIEQGVSIGVGHAVKNQA